MSAAPAAPLRVDLGIFAHDEAGGIAETIADLARQDALGDPGLSLRVHLLANGCTDDTAERARRAAAGTPLAPALEVVELAQGGKSRTWNAYVHELARPEADILAFCDADIGLPDASTLRRLISFLAGRPDLAAASSRPVKDIVHTPPPHLSATDRLISAGGGTLDDWRRSICGQLYAMRADAARGFHLPIGLPVEDGFVHAMIATDVLRRPPARDRVDGREDIFHVYRSERGVRTLVGHQTRIVIGSAINAVLFRHLPAADGGAAAELARAAADPDWLPRVLSERLPTARHGYVPWSFLTKRLRGLSARRGLKGRLVILAGFGFDAAVWLNAQQRMARGAGAGYW